MDSTRQNASQQLKHIEWLGDSLDVLRSWPASIRLNIGADLHRLQEGKRPLDRRWRETLFRTSD